MMGLVPIIRDLVLIFLLPMPRKDHVQTQLVVTTCQIEREVLQEPGHSSTLISDLSK